MTMLEAVFTVAVLIVSLAALIGMIINVENANKSLALQNNALDVFARVSAQIRDAECDLQPAVGVLQAGSTDPLLLTLAGGPPPPPGWYDAPIAGSSVTLLGRSDANPVLGDYVPPIWIALRGQVTSAAPAAPSFQIDVMIRQIMYDPVRDNLAIENGYWIRIFPVQKMCNMRADPTARGEY